MKRRYLIICSMIILLLLCFSISSFAATGKISGSIIDAETNEPLIGANVIIEGFWRNGEIVKIDLLRGAATDGDGFYYIINIPSGSYVVKAMMMGYKSKQIVDVRVESGRTIKLDFALGQTVVEGEAVTVVAKKEVVKLDVSSSEQVISGAEVQNLPVNNVEDVLQLAAGVNVDGYNNEISIRGGGSDQVMAYLDGFSMKDEVFNVPFLSFNRTSIQNITIKTGGFSAEYGDLRSGIIDVETLGGASNYSLIIDSRYAPPDYRYSGPHKYTEDKYWLMYGSDWSMDSTILHEKFPIPGLEGEQKYEFDGWNVYARNNFGTDSASSTSYLTSNQRREMWKYRHRGRKEGNVHDHILDATLSGPVPFIDDFNFMFSFRDQYDSYRHPAQRNHFGLQNNQIKLTYRLNPSMQITAMGMQSLQSGMGAIESVGGNSAVIQRSGGLGKGDGENIYTNTYHPLADIKTQNLGLSFKHVLSKNTFYEIRASHMKVDYNFRHGAVRDTTDRKFIEGEYYTVAENDSMTLHGYWDGDVYIEKDTTFYSGDQVWCPGFWLDESPDGWLYYGSSVSQLDQTGHVNLNQGSQDTELSSGWSTNIRADITHQANKYHFIKAGLSYRKSKVSRNFEHVDDILNEKLYTLQYDEYPIYYAAYLQDRFEMEGITANFGVRADLFDANADILSPTDPFNGFFFADSFKNKYVDSLSTGKSDAYFRLSPRIGISHPLTLTSKIFFNYGHAYSSPKNALRYGFRPKSEDDDRPLWVGNPNLKPYKTIQYELGYEQVIFTNYLIHGSIYMKDVSAQAASGHGTEYHKYNGTTQDFYYTWENNHYQDIVGIDLTLYKRLGNYLTGWVRTEFVGVKDGKTGFSKRYLEGDPNGVDEGNQFSYPDDRMWEWKPALLINLDLHTPDNWGPTLMGIQPLSNWRINTVIDWKAGDKFTFSPEMDPSDHNNMQRIDHFMTDIYISKTFKVLDEKVTAYLDVHNLFNRKVLNTYALRNGNLTNANDELYRYYSSLQSGDRVGDYKASHIDRPDEIPGVNYISRYGGPMRIYFGLKFNFDWK